MLSSTCVSPRLDKKGGFDYMAFISIVLIDEGYFMPNK